MSKSPIKPLPPGDPNGRLVHARNFRKTVAGWITAIISSCYFWQRCRESPGHRGRSKSSPPFRCQRGRRTARRRSL